MSLRSPHFPLPLYLNPSPDPQEGRRRWPTWLLFSYPFSQSRPLCVLKSFPHPHTSSPVTACSRKSSTGLGYVLHGIRIRHGQVQSLPEMLAFVSRLNMKLVFFYSYMSDSVIAQKPHIRHLGLQCPRTAQLNEVVPNIVKWRYVASRAGPRTFLPNSVAGDMSKLVW